jgi:hypothetical protein
MGLLVAFTNFHSLLTLHCNQKATQVGMRHPSNLWGWCVSLETTILLHVTIYVSNFFLIFFYVGEVKPNKWSKKKINFYFYFSYYIILYLLKITGYTAWHPSKVCALNELLVWIDFTGSLHISICTIHIKAIGP